MSDSEASSSRPLTQARNYYERLKETESYSAWEHFVKRGHTGKVQCIASSDATDYIVSGGEDYTMRVWAYDETTTIRQDLAKSKSYDICAVVVHDDEREKDVEEAGEKPKASGFRFFSSTRETSEEPVGVTAVACVGAIGPFISGTARGNVFVLFLGFGEEDGSLLPKVGFHSKRINEITAPFGQGELRESANWLFAAASEDGKATVFNFKGYECSHLVLQHQEDAPVRGVRHIECGGDKGVTWATHTPDAVYLWSSQGKKIKVIQDVAHLPHRTTNGSDIEAAAEAEAGRGSVEITDIAVANKENGSLLFVGIDGSLHVWSFEEGQMTGPYGERPPPEPFDRVPIITYKDLGNSLDVDQSRHSTEFYVELRDDLTCAVWGLEGAKAADLAIRPRGPQSLLISPTSRNMLIDLRHSAKVTQLRVAEDPDLAGGPCLITACVDGNVLLWDLEGVDKGEVYAELRSLRVTEIFIPIVLMLVSVFQVAAFAFGPKVQWRQEVRKPAMYSKKFLFGDVDLVIEVEKSQIFIPMAWCGLGMIFMFLVLVLTGMPELLNLAIYLTQSTKAYQSEGRSSLFGPRHLLRRILELARTMLGLFLFALSTILVAPMFKLCAEAIDCMPRDGSKYLQLAPQVECYAGSHLTMAVMLIIATPIYFLVLIPYALVEGNMKYMKWRKLFFPRTRWYEAAVRKATVLNLGPLHPNPDTVFINLLLEYAAKALLPVIEVQTTMMPAVQMALVTTIGATLYLASIFFPPKTDRMYCCIVRDLRLFTLCTMLCGCLTVALETHSIVPVCILGLCAILVPAHTILSIRNMPLRPPEVQHCSTSSTLQAAAAAQMATTSAKLKHAKSALKKLRIRAFWSR